MFSRTGMYISLLMQLISSSATFVAKFLSWVASAAM